MGLLDGKVAVVTGGSSGIGRSAVLSLAREGARVAFAARGEQRGLEVAREVEVGGGTAVFVRADVSDSAQVSALIEAARKRFGRLDLAFNNAASVEFKPTLLADCTEEQFDSSLALNLKSIWLSMRAEIRQMLAQDPPGGAIVNTSSINGLGGVAGAAFYAAAKAGLVALTKSAALEYAPRGIRVNALVAGGFDTPMLDGAILGAAGGDPEKAKALRERLSTMIPLGRIGNPDEAAQTALWLLSDAASYVTGHSLIVDGGMTAPWR